MLYINDIKRNSWSNCHYMKKALMQSIEMWANNYISTASMNDLSLFFPPVLSPIIVSYSYHYTPCDEICDDFQTIIDNEILQSQKEHEANKLQFQSLLLNDDNDID